MDDPVVTIAHFSDLHFTRNLVEDGRAMWTVGGFRTGTHLDGPHSHAFGKVEALSRAWHKRDPQVDYLLITGDVVTDGSVDAFSTARAFIEGALIRDEDGDELLQGLEVDSRRRVVLPGNHDRYGSRPFQNPANRCLEDAFLGTGAATTYPYVVALGGLPGASMPQLPTVLCFVFDSTPSAETLKQWGVSRSHYWPARGHIADSDCEWLVRTAAELNQHGAVPGLSGDQVPVQPESVVRLALIHHHPVVTRLGDKQVTLLENRGAFLRACHTARIDLVLFGHEHVWHEEEYGDAHHRMRIYGCPTATEFNGPETGFQVFGLGRSGFMHTRYMWDGGSFLEHGPLGLYRYSRR